ncbi:hypothetical protein TRFO_19996 [Tritrichomonas foetus]|uniref:E2F/DP family winged-helix DNA-binding domain-containing protein n=1 Tax=Tritrichomonas foetus TaxID=1144522 RepID=A0A1J4KLC6_9EUKA|nr:hypothetical protein TRFO_19996 [Tritrichomonas foetus]|eukprot:OHT10596.1 hypothetical protein TRFO_19996 [Tritrichomonas foetus]
MIDNNSVLFSLPIQLNSSPACIEKNSVKNQDLLSVIAMLESHIHKPMTIFSIGHNSNVSSKRLYEMMNVACVIGACRKCEGSLYIWQGVDKIKHRLIQLFAETEAEACQVDMAKMFKVKSPPSIEELTTKFLKLYFYLGKQSIEIRDAVLLFSANGSKSQTILRRLYCIANILATFQVIDHPHHRAQFIINIDVTLLAKHYYERNNPQKKMSIDVCNILTLLNHVGTNKLDKIYDQRQSSFTLYLDTIVVTDD